MRETVKVADLRDLDALVAEHVMGWVRWTCDDYDFKEAVLFHPGADLQSWKRCDPSTPLAEFAATMAPNWSESIAAAWEVVERLRAEPEKWQCTIVTGVGASVVKFTPIADGPMAVATTEEPEVPTLICLAALRAKGVTVELAAEKEVQGG